MSITVGIGDPNEPRTLALLKAHHELMTSLFPVESNHFLAGDALCVPEITFLVAQEEGQHLGCGALADRGDYGEIKSMFVADAARGKGVANKIVMALLAKARASGLPKVYLETGDTLHAAHALYEKHGFTYCEPFGAYAADPLSLFMELTL